jgi:signal transduction histidine kinase
MKHKNGNWIWILDKGKVIERDEKGNPIRMAGTHLDITKRKEAENELIHTQNQLSLLYANLANIREDERKVIARELHDELGQVLTSLNMNLSLLKNNVKNKLLDETRLINELEDMSKIIDESKINIKKLIRTLRPEYLDNLGLIPALNHLVEEFSKNTNMNIDFNYNDEDIRIEPNKENIIYRLVQESLTNIIKHANASTVNIKMHYENSTLTLTIEDDGKGINSADFHKIDSFGLLGMRERVSQIGSNLVISGLPEKGTKLSVAIKV